MKHLWLAAVMVAMLPVVASAGDRGDRYRGGRSHYERSARYEHRDHGRRHYDKGDRHHYKSRSHSSFDFSIGFSSGGYYGGDYSSFRYTYSNYPVYRRPVYVERPVYIEQSVYVETPVYYPPPAVIYYTPPARVYYYEPIYAPRYYYGGRYSYCR